MSSELVSLEKDTVLSVYCEMLAEKFDDLNPRYVNILMYELTLIDGSDLTSYGNQEALDWVRKVPGSDRKRFNTVNTEAYLMMKGDARDLDLLTWSDKERLATWVAGTNVINCGLTGAEGMPIYWGGCIPQRDHQLVQDAQVGWGVLPPHLWSSA